jgi:hypothetical protein
MAQASIPTNRKYKIKYFPNMFLAMFVQRRLSNGNYTLTVLHLDLGFQHEVAFVLLKSLFHSEKANCVPHGAE